MITGEVYPEIVAELERPERERKQRVEQRALEILQNGRWFRLQEHDTWRLASADGKHYVDLPAPLFVGRPGDRASLTDDLKLVAFQKLCALLDPEVAPVYS